MTHDILQSDITLATSLVAVQRPDDEIILALVHRGVDSSKATALLDDLHSGRKPSAPSPLSQEMAVPRRSRSRNGAQGTSRSSPARSPAREPHHQRQSAPAHRGRTNPVVFWGLTIFALVLVIGLLGFTLFQRYYARADSQEKQGLRAGSAMPSGARQTTAPAAGNPVGLSTPLVLELQPDGLRMGGSLVTQGNLLPAVASLLGVPTRTNRVGQTSTLVYAYDRHGLLIYCQPRGGTNSIVLDCEASGGVNGSTSAFAGMLKVEDQVIGPDTTPQSLARIKKLSLGSPSSDGTIWGGRYNSFEVVFAYSKATRHLSLIEIDLK